MDSKELGLVLAQQLLSVEDLHYGYWDPTEETTLGKLKDAQETYSQLLISTVEAFAGQNIRMLDVGCGTGHLMSKFLAKGNEVDCVIPAPHLEKQVHGRIETLALKYRPIVYNCFFQDFPAKDVNPSYDVILFSESFQYMPTNQSLPLVKKLLKPGGHLIICDFFKTSNDGDGQPGDRAIGGGHLLSKFYTEAESQSFEILKDEDITKFTSPNLELLDDVISNRMVPAAITIDKYLSVRKPKLYGFIKWIFRKKLVKLKFKYMEGHRNKAVFERYKTYRLLAMKPK